MLGTEDTLEIRWNTIWKRVFQSLKKKKKASLEISEIKNWLAEGKIQ